MEKELAAMRLLVSQEGNAAPKKVKKVVQEGEEVVKRAPNAWILFTSRLNTLLKANGHEIPVAQQKTFASMLKKLDGEGYTNMSDEDILAQLKGWDCPEPTPRKKKDTASETSSDAGSEKKARKPQSEETKAAAALKRAATKAAKAAAAAVAAEAAESSRESSIDSPSVLDRVTTLNTKMNSKVDDDASSTAAGRHKVKPEEKKSSKKVDDDNWSTAAAVQEEKKSPKKVTLNPDALRFNSWSYEGEDCWQNDRGDSLNPEGEWMGRMVKGKMTMTAQSDMPGDLEPFIQELME